MGVICHQLNVYSEWNNSKTHHTISLTGICISKQPFTVPITNSQLAVSVWLLLLTEKMDVIKEREHDWLREHGLLEESSCSIEDEPLVETQLQRKDRAKKKPKKLLSSDDEEDSTPVTVTLPPGREQKKVVYLIYLKTGNLYKQVNYRI